MIGRSFGNLTWKQGLCFIGAVAVGVGVLTTSIYFGILYGVSNPPAKTYNSDPTYYLKDCNISLKLVYGDTPLSCSLGPLANGHMLPYVKFGTTGLGFYEALGVQLVDLTDTFLHQYNNSINGYQFCIINGGPARPVWNPLPYVCNTSFSPGICNIVFANHDKLVGNLLSASYGYNGAVGGAIITKASDGMLVFSGSALFLPADFEYPVLGQNRSIFGALLEEMLDTSLC